MKLDRTTIINLSKILSFLCLIFVVIVFVNVMFNEDLEIEKLIKIKKSKEEKKKSNHCKNYSNKFFYTNDFTSKEKFSLFKYILALSEYKYIYYSFALVLGGVFNSKNLVKIGIF